MRGVRLAFALLTACAGGTAETTTTASATTTASSTTASPPPPPVRISSPACGYGGSATAVAVFVDVETDVALHGVTIDFAVADTATHAIAGHSTEPRITVVSPVERGVLDFSTQGTTPFDGELAAGARIRLQHFAGVDALPADGAGPIEVQATMTTGDGQRFEVTCTTEQMWPSS